MMNLDSIFWEILIIIECLNTPFKMDLLPMECIIGHNFYILETLGIEIDGFD